MYSVNYTSRALKELRALDKHTKALIYSWIDKNLERCANPRARGKGLTSTHSGEWRYRVGDYRIIAQIFDDKVLILIISVGKRDKVYRTS